MGARIRAGLRTISSAPWRRAPLLLWRRPGVLATVAGACAVVAASVAAVPLFLSSAGTESVALQAAERCPRDTGATLSLSASADEVVHPPPDPFRPVADRLGPPNRWLRLVNLPLSGADPSRDVLASMLVRDGALDHVEVLEGSDGPGAWLPDRAVEATGLQVGDRARFGGAEVPVVGIYRDVAGMTVDDFWCSNADMVLLQVRGFDLVLPPPLVIVDPDTFAGVMGDLQIPSAQGAWEAPLRGELTSADTEELVRQLACRPDDAPALTWCAGERPPVSFINKRDFSRVPVMARDDADFVERFLHSHLPFVTARSRAIRTSVAGGIWPMAGLAALAGVGLVAAAASLWFDRRRREVVLLGVRGVSPAGLGVKAVLELSIPSLVGVVAGVALAYGTVVWLGPSPVVEPTAIRQAAVGGLAALLGSAATVWAVVTRRAATHHGGRLRRIRLGAIPWELVLGAATVVSYQRLGDWGIPVGRGADVSRVDVVGLLFPVLFLVTAVAVLSRVLGLTLRPLRRASRSWPTALYLGVRRVDRYRVAVLGLVAASAIATGVLGYAATMNRSLEATLDAKARTYVGSDVAVRVPAAEHIPLRLAPRSTVVRLHRDALIDDGRRQKASVVAIDPSTFEQAAFWDPTFSDESLGEILDRLSAPPEGGLVPAVVVGGEVGGTAEVRVLESGTPRFKIERLDGVRAFPGMKRPKATVFVTTSALEAIGLDGGTPEVWVRGERDQVLRTLGTTGVAFHEDRQVSEVADGASFVTVAWTFGFMQSLGISAGLLVIGGVAVYLDARRRDRLLGYAFMRRMGLSSQQHRRALAVELTASVLIGCWTGLGIAIVAAWLAHQRIDPVPTFRPDPLLRPAGAMALVLFAASLLVTGAVVGLAQRRIDRDDPVEVLRAGA